MRWRNCGSPQCLHGMVCGATMASCARRMLRRDFECRRFGFGMALSSPAGRPCAGGLCVQSFRRSLSLLLVVGFVGFGILGTGVPQPLEGLPPGIDLLVV